MINKDNEPNELRIKTLEIGFVKKDFIGNFKTNYEDYLTEFINKSRFVKDKGNKKFAIIEKQSNGESDITNGIYSMDYKLLVDKKTIENMFYYNETITVDKNGAIIYGASRKTGKWKKYIFINILKGLSENDIKNINNMPKSKLDNVQKLVKDYIRNIEKDKNILYFIPYNLYFKNQTMDIDKLQSVAKKLSEGLRGFMEYRLAYIKDKDTYFSFISNENIVFLKYENGLKIYDIVPLKESKLYLKIEDISDSWSFCN